MTNIRVHVGDFLPALLFRISEQGVKFKWLPDPSCAKFRTFDEDLRVSDALTRPEVAALMVVHTICPNNIEKGLIGGLLVPLERVLYMLYIILS